MTIKMTTPKYIKEIGALFTEYSLDENDELKFASSDLDNVENFSLKFVVLSGEYEVVFGSDNVEYLHPGDVLPKPKEERIHRVKSGIFDINQTTIKLLSKTGKLLCVSPDFRHRISYLPDKSLLLHRNDILVDIDTGKMYAATKDSELEGITNFVKFTVNPSKYDLPLNENADSFFEKYI